MKTRFKTFIPLFIASILFISCSDDDTVIDTENPEITVIEPHPEDAIAPGSELHIEAILADNVGLSSYKIEIHDDLDEHTHAIYKTSHDLNPWSWEETFTIPGGLTSFEADHTITVPTEINETPISEGTYHIGIYVTDTSGNQQEIFVEIHIEANAEEHAH